MKAPALGLGAAALFGLSAPAAKALLGAIDPWLLAGLLYLGSAIGLAGVRAMRRAFGAAAREAALARRDAPWLFGAILVGGVIGPVLLMTGLARGRASEASLLLNLEGVMTALIAWAIVREHVPVRIAAGMAAITVGALTLAWDPAAGVALDSSGLLIMGACLAWAIDNNLTRAVSGADPVQVAMLKGAVAGSVNVVIAVGRGASWPPPGLLLSTGIVGMLGYGISLVLFVMALRHLGTSRAGAYFSTAPFIGAAAAVVALGEPMTTKLAAAGGLMALGVWLHLTERHDHEHVHPALEHEHAHYHDEHHQHDHPPGTGLIEPHTHWHAHGPLRHRHPHYPDLHHRHEHPD